MVERSTRRKFLVTTGFGISLIAGCQTTQTPTGAETPTSKPTEASDPQHNHQTESSEFSDDTVSKAKDLGKTVQKSVVKLKSGNDGGTGWIVDSGYIVTNSHVVRSTKTMEVETYEGKTGTATRVGYHDDMIPDVALLSTDINTPPPLDVQPDADLAKGDPVLLVGHPAKLGDWVICLGRYSKYAEGVNWELSDIPSDHGNSGSPILTLSGSVFGCYSGTTTMSGSGGSSRVDRPERVYTEFPGPKKLGTAVPSKTVSQWVDEWK